MERSLRRPTHQDMSLYGMGTMVGGIRHCSITELLPGRPRFLPTVDSFVSGGSGLTLWDLRNDGEEQALPVPVKSINAVEFSPDGRTLALASQCDGDIVLWNLAPMATGPTLLKNEHPILSLSVLARRAGYAPRG